MPDTVADAVPVLSPLLSGRNTRSRKSSKTRLLDKINVSLTSGSPPNFRVKSSIQVLADRQKLLIYGGFDEDDNLDTNIYLLDLATNTWDPRINSVSREGHTTNYIGNGNVVVFGGVPDDELLNEPTSSEPNAFSSNINHTSNGGSHNVDEPYSSSTMHNSDELQRSQLLMYNVSSNRWVIPRQRNLGCAPAPRSRHATCLSKDSTKLFISGGFNSSNNELFDDLYCYDLSTGKWDGPRKFVKRFDHHLTFYNNKIWSFGGLDKNMNYINSNEINYFDLTSNVTGKIEIYNLPKLIGDHVYLPISSVSSSNNSGGSQSGIFSNFVSSPVILDVIIPLWNSYKHNNTNGYEISTPCISLLDLNDLKWKKILYGNFEPLNRFVWRHVFINDNYLYMLGYPLTSDINLTSFDYKLTNLIKIDLTQLGLKNEPYEKNNILSQINNVLLSDKLKDEALLNSHAKADFHNKYYDSSNLTVNNDNANYSLVLDFAKFLHNEEFTDFQIIGIEGFKRPPLDSVKLRFIDSATEYQNLIASNPNYSNFVFLKSKPLNVHLSILLARWPYLRKMIASGMTESNSKQLFIQEPISWLKSLVQFLYTGSLLTTQDDDLYGLLLISHYYDIEALFSKTLMILNSRSLSTVNALKFYTLSLQVNDAYVLKKKALEFIFNNWGSVVKSVHFAKLSKLEILQLCQEVNKNSSVVSLNSTNGNGSRSYNKLSINNDFNITNAIEDNVTDTSLNYYFNNETSKGAAQMVDASTTTDCHHAEASAAAINATSSNTLVSASRRSSQQRELTTLNQSHDQNVPKTVSRYNSIIKDNYGVMFGPSQPDYSRSTDASDSDSDMSGFLPGIQAHFCNGIDNSDGEGDGQAEAEEDDGGDEEEEEGNLREDVNREEYFLYQQKLNQLGMHEDLYCEGDGDDGENEDDGENDDEYLNHEGAVSDSQFYTGRANGRRAVANDDDDEIMDD